MSERDAERSVSQTVRAQLALRDMILSGRLRPGSAVPSSRGLAADLGVARSTVVLAFEQLKAAGYLTVRQGASARVSESLPDLAPRREPPRRAAPPATAPAELPVSNRLHDAMRHAAPFPGIFTARGARPFRLGVPAFDLFPMDAWGRVLTRAWRATSPRALGYGVVAFTMIEIAQGRLEDVTVHLAGIPEVLEAHTITGAADLMVRLVARSNGDLQRVIDDVVSSPYVVRASTVIVLATEIASRVLPLVDNPD